MPAPPGIKVQTQKTPMWGTGIARSRSMRETRVSEQIYPLYEIELSCEVLRDAGSSEIRQMLGFFNARNGAFDSFLYTDPDDYTVTNEQFGICDGTTTQFQLTRSVGGFIEPVQNVNAITNVKRNGVALANPADYTNDSAGLITLVSPGTNGHALTWSGTYYWRVRFNEDKLEFGKLFQGLWEVKKLPLVGSVMNKV